MSVEAHHSDGHARPQRLWIVETLVVIGVIAFGYFAMMQQDAARSGAVAPVDPIAQHLLQLPR